MGKSILVSVCDGGDVRVPLFIVHKEKVEVTVEEMISYVVVHFKKLYDEVAVSYKEGGSEEMITAVADGSVRVLTWTWMTSY